MGLSSASGGLQGKGPEDYHSLPPTKNRGSQGSSKSSGEAVPLWKLHNLKMEPRTETRALKSLRDTWEVKRGKYEVTGAEKQPEEEYRKSYSLPFTTHKIAHSRAHVI